MHILVVEDNRADSRLIEQALRDYDGAHQVSVVADGQAAMAFVSREQPYTTVRRTDLMLLDLNLPYKDGREVVAECKANPVLRHIPIIIWTSTQAAAEVRQLYTLGAAAYCVKPSTLDDYLGLVQKIVEFWGSRHTRLVEG